MNLKSLLKTFIFLILTFGSFTLNAQVELVVKQKDNQKFSLEIAKIRKLTFTEQALLLHPKTGVVQNYGLNDLSKLFFSNNPTAVRPTTTLFEQLEVFPTPASEYINITYKTKNNENVVIKIVDLHGRVVHEDAYSDNINVNTKQINIKHLSAGVYILHLQSSQQSESRKILIK
ncbi:Por secretion system C-terminal sorting domain-containing protein [Saccharicrinis carchari]|uniref:Por secretion system C-terminal sorting domain-containing protein n=1 Tax=Saccharicrinis carchari TaxID=1168039 RepID=A0A521E4B7_SACCC|nr:T9SS type A sorting domain-containing protein [Saccharicrinis carchari]SMO78020.1 Por secretion system C-terminal sorting domain-containing protein [Saccharicrinis carchari]